MKRCSMTFALGLVLISFSQNAWAADSLPLRPRPGFVKLPNSIELDACSGVAVGKEGEVFLFHRGKQPIIALSASGEFLRAWGDDLIHTAHGMRVDAEGNLWVTDIGNHQVYKFTPTGERLMTLGKAGTAGDGIDEFDKPTDVAFGPRGEIYVSDGYGNSRVMKFTANGGFLTQWGEAGTGPGQFDTPHAVRINQAGKVVVGDRENDRIQVFDANGQLLHVWEGYAPFGLAYDSEGRLLVADGRAHQILQLDDQGKVVGRFGKEGNAAGQFQLPHMLATDRSGGVYVAEVLGKRVQKLVRE